MADYTHYSAFVLMDKFKVDLATARKIKSGELDPADIEKKPRKPKKSELKDSEVEDGS